MNELNYSEIIRVNNKADVITQAYRAFLHSCDPSSNEIELIEYIDVTLNKSYTNIILNAVIMTLFNSGNLDIKRDNDGNLVFRTIGSDFVSITDKHMDIYIGGILLEDSLRSKIFTIIHDQAMLDMLNVKLNKPMIKRK